MKLADRAFAVKMIAFLAFVLAAFCFTVPDARAQISVGGGSSTIQGTVFDKQRNRLPEIDVELLNDYYQTIRRTKTDGAGSYNFNGLANGRFTIKVYAFRYDLEDQEIPLEINTQNIRGGEGAGYFIQDFYLQPKRGGLKEAELSVVFAQEVPNEAKAAYEKAIKDLSEKRTQEGIDGLLKAIKVFPDYYLALSRLGQELYMRGQYKDAVTVYLKATSINQKSAVSYYYLGFSLHKLGKDYNKAAFASVSKAAILAPASPQVLWLLGKIERSMGELVNAEKHLLQAKKLSTSKNPEISWELAQTFADLKKYKEAADELEIYIKIMKLSDEEEKQVKNSINMLREKAKG